MSVAKLLDEVELVLSQRHAAYGDASPSLAAIAARWSITLGCGVTPAQVALCMIDVKLTRLSFDPKHRDSLIDVIGYAALLTEVSHDQRT